MIPDESRLAMTIQSTVHTPTTDEFCFAQGKNNSATFNE
jgi:hypothetical protein